MTAFVYNRTWWYVPCVSDMNQESWFMVSDNEVQKTTRAYEFLDKNPCAIHYILEARSLTDLDYAVGVFHSDGGLMDYCEIR